MHSVKKQKKKRSVFTKSVKDRSICNMIFAEKNGDDSSAIPPAYRLISTCGAGKELLRQSHFSYIEGTSAIKRWIGYAKSYAIPFSV